MATTELPRPSPQPPPDQYAALRTGCGVAPSSARTVLRMSGEDRARFLQGLVTCDVDSLEPGQGTWGFFTSIKGRVLADVAVWVVDDESWWLAVPAGSGEAIREHALKYRIADRVEIEVEPELSQVAVAGPQAESVLAAEGLVIPAGAEAQAAGELAGIAVRVVREPRLGVPGVSLWTPPGAVEELIAGLRQRRPEVASVSEAAFDLVRIEAGMARYGIDYGGDHFPQETGLGERAVSYTKGCYLGQEVVARIHYRGGVNRGLAGVRLDEPPAGGEPATLLHDGRAAGRLTSVAYSPGAEGWIGLSVLHQRASEVGTELAVESDGGRGAARVAELPFVG